jgi:peptidoglycan/xylan/chitin deacetylase (PgdA/CDA1 family)
LTIAGALVIPSVGNLYPASGLPTVASMARVGPAETMESAAPVRCSRYVALTYDDGPTAFTAATSDLLRRYRLHATFFVTSEQIQNSREVVYALAAEAMRSASTPGTSGGSPNSHWPRHRRRSIKRQS